MPARAIPTVATRTVSVAALALTTLTLTPLPGQAPRPDRRDQIELTSGAVRTGRVVQRYEPEHLLISDGGNRDKIPWPQVARIKTVADMVAELLDMRSEGLSLAAEWSLAEIAHARGLEDLARLQAWHVLLRDPDHEAAHALLGNAGKKGAWRWRWDGEFLSPAAVAKKAESRFELRSEHFRLRSETGLRVAIDTLFDLERAYATFWREFGKELRPLSLFDPIEVELHPSADALPKLNSDLADPYCDPSVRGGSVVHTYLVAPTERAANLAGVTLEQLLYTTLLTPKAGRPDTFDERIAAWLEIGLSHWFTSRSQGRPGYLRLEAPKLDLVLADRALRHRPYGLEQLIHLRIQHFFEDRSLVGFHLANTAMFVAWLMDPDVQAGDPKVDVRPRFLAYVRACFHDGKGNGSSLLDDCLGREIGRLENCEAPWVAWLSAKSGIAATRVPYDLPTPRSLRRLIIGR